MHPYSVTVTLPIALSIFLTNVCNFNFYLSLTATDQHTDVFMEQSHFWILVLGSEPII